MRCARYLLQRIQNYWPEGFHCWSFRLSIYTALSFFDHDEQYTLQNLQHFFDLKVPREIFWTHKVLLCKQQRH